MLTSTNLLPAAMALATPIWSTFGGANAYAAPIQFEADVGGHVSGNSYSPTKSVNDRLKYIGSLESGWDGHLSAPISKISISNARHVIALVREIAPFEKDPAIVPCADGSLQIEWHLVDSRFEMYFENDGSVGAWWDDRSTGREFEAEGTEAHTLIGHWAVRDAVWPKLILAA